MQKTYALACLTILFLTSLTDAQTFVTIDSSKPLGAFMIANELPSNGGAYIFADNWSPDTATGRYSDSDTLVLEPEKGAYDTSPDLSFWRENGVGPRGNKQMTASVFVVNDRVLGAAVSFDFNVDSITFTEHASFAFLRVFDADYNTLVEAMVDLDQTGYYNLILTAEQTSLRDATHFQYGFTTVGINSSSALAPSYGSIIISAAAPQPLEPSLFINVDPFKKEYFLSGSATGMPYVEDSLFFPSEGGKIFWNNPDPGGTEWVDFLSQDAFIVSGNTAYNFVMYFHNTGNINGALSFDGSGLTTLEGNPSEIFNYADWSPDLIAEIEDKAASGEILPLLDSNYDDAFRIAFKEVETAAPAIGLHVGLQIDGAIGLTYRIEYKDAVDQLDWETLEEVVLPYTPFIYADPSPPSEIAERLYRVVLVD